MVSSQRDPDRTAFECTHSANADARGALRVLVVEDELLLAAALEEDLKSAEFTIVGPFKTLALAVKASRQEQFDVAVLDVNLNGELIYPLAEELQTRRIPFLFLTGFNLAEMPEKFRATPRMAKPQNRNVLINEVRRIVASARRR